MTRRSHGARPLDIRYIQELLGHASTRTTQVYTHVSRRGIGHVRSPLDLPGTEGDVH